MIVPHFTFLQICRNPYFPRTYQRKFKGLKKIWLAICYADLLIQFMPMVSFYISSKHQKTSDFLIFFRAYRKRSVAWKKIIHLWNKNSILQFLWILLTFIRLWCKFRRSWHCFNYKEQPKKLIFSILVGCTSHKILHIKFI